MNKKLQERDLASVQTLIIFFTQYTEDPSNVTNRRSGLFGLSFVGMAIFQKRVSVTDFCIMNRQSGRESLTSPPIVLSAAKRSFFG